MHICRYLHPCKVQYSRTIINILHHLINITFLYLGIHTYIADQNHFIYHIASL